MSFGVVSSPGSARSRQRFLSELFDICGDTRLLWLPSGGDTTTSTDASLNGRTVTYNATVASQIGQLGYGHTVSFDGSTDYGSVADADGLSFGDGTDDNSFSVIVLAKVTDTATSRVFAAKYSSAANQREWEFRLTTGDVLAMTLYDESTDVAPLRLSSSAITQGQWTMYGGTYDGTGGSTAANGMVLYQNGVAIASAATNNASYVAMENGSGPVGIGAENTDGTPANYFSGDMALVAVVAKALTATEMYALYQLCVWYFNFLA